MNLAQKHMVNNFSHKVGIHCESSAMRDLFEFVGFPMTEAMAFGLDGTMGFGFFVSTEDNSEITEPFFIGGKQDTIKPNSLACRLLGINLRKQSFSSADKAWEESKELINQDVPLIIQADIAYLPFQTFEDEFHFGGHSITLAGYDEEKHTAYVGDTEFEGFQEISIEELKQARSSEKGSSWMFPKNTQYSMSLRADGKRPPFAAGVKLAIQNVCNHMLRSSMNFHGLQGLRRFADSILQWDEILMGAYINPYSNKEYNLAEMMFELTHGYIERWGTGGALFRNLYKHFLEELLTHPELKEGPRSWNKEDFRLLEESNALIEESAKNWTLIAETLRVAAEEFKEDCIKNVNLVELHKIALSILSKEEELFKKLSKIKI